MSMGVTGGSELALSAERQDWDGRASCGVSSGRLGVLEMALGSTQVMRETGGPHQTGPHRRTQMLSDYPSFPILLSKDLDAARAFYHDTLGLEILREDPGDRIIFRSGSGTQIAVSPQHDRHFGYSDPDGMARA